MVGVRRRTVRAAGSELRSTRHRATTGYLVTHAHARAVVVALALAALALALGRVDAVVLGVPFIVVALWGWATRPETPAGLHARSRFEALTEGAVTSVAVEVDGPAEAESAVVLVDRPPRVSLGPASGLRAAVLTGGRGRVEVSVRPERWGLHRIGPVLVRVGSAWDAYSSTAVEFDPLTVRVAPELQPYAGRAGVPHPRGLAGGNAARHLAPGVEFADVRPFTPGDRLRHIAWPLSLRTGELHVTRSHAEVDGEVVLLVDAVADLGTARDDRRSETTLDRSVRAAGALGRHFLAQGDRVGLEVVGANDQVHLPLTGGRHQLDRLVDALSTIRVGSRDWVSETTPRLRARPGALVLVLTPAVSPTFLGWAVHLRRLGYRVVVVDTLGGALPAEPGVPTLTWRLRMLQREQELRLTAQRSVPVVPWYGPRSLDPVLRQLARGGAA